MNDETKQSYATLSGLAAKLGLPKSWLLEEAKAGRIPCLKVGSRLRFQTRAVAESLSTRVLANVIQEKFEVVDAR